MAKLYFRHSVMNAGKSLHLLQTKNNYKERKKETLLLTAALDTRNGEGVISSRLGVSSEAMGISDVADIEVLKYAIHPANIEAIFVDESQFLSPDVIDALASVVDNYDIPVFCYGLKTDFRGELFPGSKRLLELADSVQELKSICMCGRKALFNRRMIESTEQVVLGSEDIYETQCRKCFMKGR